jgi:hypothetical protein
MEETNPPSAKAATREAIIASLKEVAKGTENLRPYVGNPGLLPEALDRDKQIMIMGDRVKVYDQVEAYIVFVTKTGDLIIVIDDKFYYCLAGNVRSQMINPP